MKLRTIVIGELQNYLTSDEYLKSAIIPVTMQRVASQIHNPRAETTDPALILAEDESGNVLGFIGLLPDYIFYPEKRKCYWISCWWSDPVKGKMLGVPLLLSAYQAVQGMLLADATPDTLGVFQKSKLFIIPEPKKGLKLFLTPFITQVLLRKKPGLKPYKSILKGIDLMISFLFLPVNFIRGSSGSGTGKISVTHKLNKCAIESEAGIGVFGRKKPEFEWILSYPWVIAPAHYLERRFYPFSSTSKEFSHHQLLISENEMQIGFLHVTCRDGVAKLAYADFNEEFIEIVVKALLSFLYKVKASEFISFHISVNNCLRKKPLTFCIKHETSYQYVWGKPLGDLPLEQFQFGDGDAIFT